MAELIKLSSNFNDYYDDYFNTYGVEFKRIKENSLPRGKALNMLDGYGYNVIKLSQVSMILPTDKIVVYTDLKAHKGQGKIICSYEEAKDIYSNYLGAPFIKGTNGASMKVVQIGSRRFRVLMHNDYYETRLIHGEVVSIEELTPEFNNRIHLPIFSIDYIPYNDTMLVTDFNPVQNLGELGFDSILHPNDVIAEVKKNIYRYGK